MYADQTGVWHQVQMRHYHSSTSLPNVVIIYFSSTLFMEVFHLTESKFLHTEKSESDFHRCVMF